MFPRRLKTNIAINIAVLLFISMLLIDFVTVMTAKKNLLQYEISKGNLTFSAIENYVSLLNVTKKSGSNPDIKEYLREITRNESFSCLLVLDKSNKELYFEGKNCNLDVNYEQLARRAIESGRKTIQYFGKSWGVFWRQKRDLVISAPLHTNTGKILGGACIAIQLDKLYQVLRQMQAILFVYIFVNTFILSAIGLYRLSKITLKPLQRLAKRAEEYEEDDELLFSVRQEDTEFSRLSKALNRMLKRIAGDKEKLRSTVTSLEKANLDLKQAQREIIRAEKLASVGRLSSGIAHEIGNPIGIVLGYLELLKQKGISDAEKNDFISRAENEINRIRAIIRQLLDFSRPSEGDLKIVSVHEVVRDVVEIAKFEPLMSNINIELALSAENDTVVADPNQLRQVFLNIMINAADAIFSSKRKDEGKLIIQSENVSGSNARPEGHPDMLKLLYIDNGPGIPVEYIENIFDPFYTTKEPGKGTGLGLSVCYMIIEGIDGKIEASSKENEGTQITIFLPLHEKSLNKQ